MIQDLSLDCMCDLTRAVPTFEAHPKGGTGGLELDAGARVSAGPRGVLIIAKVCELFALFFLLFPSLDCLRGRFSPKKRTMKRHL